MEPDKASLREQKRKRTEDAITDAAFRLFEEKGFDAVSVEEIAATAEVAPRTFYRYFPTKEDVVFFAPGARAAVERALAETSPAEGDVERVARVVVAGMTARSPKHAAEMYRLVETTPALQARVFQSMWDSQDVLVEALLSKQPRTHQAEFRARIISQTVAHVVRVAYVTWIRSGQRGPVWKQCEKALAVLRDAFR